MTIYEELGLPEDANEREITQSLREMNKRLHPDLHPESAARRLAEAQMMRLRGMAKTLLSRKRRSNYVASLEQSSEPDRQHRRSAWLWLSACVLTVCLAYGLWQTMRAPGLLADALFRPSISAEEGPVMLSSPDHVEPLRSRKHKSKATESMIDLSSWNAKPNDKQLNPVGSRR